MRERDRVVLYRKGFPNGNRSCWFTSIRDAVNYDGRVFDENIYLLTLAEKEFVECFEESGEGYALRENVRCFWEAINLRVRKVPSKLVEMISIDEAD